MTLQRRPLNPPIDISRAARVLNVLAGGVHSSAADRELAARIQAAWPQEPERHRTARDFHYRAAERALANGARGVIVGAAGYPLRCEPPHNDMLAPYPDARITYATPDEEIAAFLRAAVAGKAQASVCEASVRDPGGLMSCPEIASLPEPWCLIVRFSLHWWPAEVAERLLASYGKMLPPGSLLVATVIVPGAGRAGDELLALLSEAGGTAYRHSAGDVRAWLHDAGLRDVTVRDVRAFARPWAAAEFAARAGNRILGVVGRVR